MKLTFTEEKVTPDALRDLFPTANRNRRAIIRQYRRKDGTRVLEFEIPNHTFSVGDETLIQDKIKDLGYSIFEGRS